MDALLISASPPDVAVYPAIDEIDAWARSLPAADTLHRDTHWRLVDVRAHLSPCDAALR